MKKLFLILLTAISFNSYSDTSINNFKVSAKLNAKCLLSVNDISFGVVDQNAVGFTGSVNHITKMIPVDIYVLCNNKTPFILRGTTTETRSGIKSKFLDNTEGGPDALAYYIYMSPVATSTNGFNGTTNATMSITSNGTGILQHFNVYAGLFASKTYPGYHVRPGIYRDNFSVHIDY